MTRLEKLAKKATKKFGGRQVTQGETKHLLEDYLPGIRQQYKGEVMAITIERFLAQVPKFNRDSFESGVRELHTYSNSNGFGPEHSR